MGEEGLHHGGTEVGLDFSQEGREGEEVGGDASFSEGKHQVAGDLEEDGRNCYFCPLSRQRSLSPDSSERSGICAASYCFFSYLLDLSVLPVKSLIFCFEICRGNCHRKVGKGRKAE